MIEAEENKEYLPIEGLAAFRKATLQLLLGSGHPAVQEVSNTTLVSPVRRSTLSHCQSSYPHKANVYARMRSNTRVSLFMQELGMHLNELLLNGKFPFHVCAVGFAT